MQKIIAPYLLSTYKLIQCAFPKGIETNDYLPLLALLDDEMSDRSLAQIIAQYTGKEYGIVLNDLYRIKSIALDAEAIAKVKQQLLACGYDQWLEET